MSKFACVFFLYERNSSEFSTFIHRCLHLLIKKLPYATLEQTKQHKAKIFPKHKQYQENVNKLL